MIIVGAVAFMAILMMVIMVMVLYFKRGKKKLPPADVIPGVSTTQLYYNFTFISNRVQILNFQHHINEKGCKESDRSSNISDLKVDIRAGSCEPDYSETCSGSESIQTRLAANLLGSSGNGYGGNVPLAGPVKIPGDYR